MKKILVITAHPDDETFGPGATIAKYASEGVEIHLLCATRGESGQWSKVGRKGRKLGEVREEEQREALKVLGVKEVEYLDYIDGYISNKDLDPILERVKEKVASFKPEIILTLDLLGLSGHLDHIAMAQVAAKAFDSEEKVRKLYYFVIPQEFSEEMWQKHHRKNFGRKKGEITTQIDVEKYLPKRIEAAGLHQTQGVDFERLVPFWKKFGKTDYFVLGGSRVKTIFPENDLFTGIG